MKIGSLCTGYGGLDRGVQLALGGETVWVSDIDKGANKILAHRYPDVPNLGDFTTTDWAAVEPIDVLTAGFPCQPVSHAGKRLGDNDERWLWDDVARAVGALRPGLVVLENVRGLLTAGAGRLFGRVLGALAELGYDAQWHGLRAADVGAPHGRWRVFVVATPRDAHLAGLEGHRLDGERAGERAAGPTGAEPALLPTPSCSDTNGAGAHGDGGVDLRTAITLLPTPRVSQPGYADDGRGGKSLDVKARLLPTPSVADVQGGRKSRSGERNDELLLNGIAHEDRWGDYAAAIARWEHVLGRPAPPPTMTSAKGNPQLSPAFVEWLMGLPAGWVTDVPGITRNEALKALGNGVVAQQCAAALRLMLGGQVASAAPTGDLLPTPRSLDATGVRGVTPNRSTEDNRRAGATLTDFALGSIDREAGSA